MASDPPDAGSPAVIGGGRQRATDRAPPSILAEPAPVVSLAPGPDGMRAVSEAVARRRSIVLLQAKVIGRNTKEHSFLGDRPAIVRTVDLVARGGLHTITLSHLTEEEFSELPLKATVMLTILPETAS